VVGVGSVRPQVRIDIPSIRAPQQIQPDDKFRVLVDVIGEGLGDQEFDVSLDVSAVKKPENDAKKVEEPMEITIVEVEDPKNPKKARIQHVICEVGKKITLKPETPAKFDRSTPARAEVEFQVDAARLAAAAGIKLEEGKRWEFVELKGGALRFQARVPKNRMEIFGDKDHVSETGDVRVLKRELRVLLMASAAMRDYQFVRTLLVREMDAKRADLCIHLQLPPGRSELRKGIVQDVAPERLLTRFPDTLDVVPEDADPVSRFYDLSHYDVIIAFDPDWNQLTPQEIENVRKWVDKGGGLIVVGGPINTVQLASPGANKPTEKFAPLVDLYPVILDDVRLREGERKTDDPFPLTFDAATADMEFLRLTEEGDKNYNPGFREDWEEFYGKGKDGKGKIERGFYNFYPVEKSKTGSLVVARFFDPDPKAKLKDNTYQPYLVISPPESGRRVVWIGSAETWRLRAFREAYHERFWIKLARYAGARNQGKISRRITPFIESIYAVNRAVSMDFKIDNKGGEPLGKPKLDVNKPKIELTLPKGVAPNEIKTKFDLFFKADGLWGAQFPVRSPGKYGLKVTVPETGDTYEGKFDVKDANPELDNTRPDFEAMMKLAGDADPVLQRMDPTEAKKLEALLQQKQRSQRGDGATSAEEKLKLVFDLKSAELIPECMRYNFDLQRNRGAVTDLWDWSFTLQKTAFYVVLIIAMAALVFGVGAFVLGMAVRSIASEANAAMLTLGLVFFLAASAIGFELFSEHMGWGPVKVPVVLLIVVGLLSLEWLTRKLLRLA
jgi:hypothetical protein